jgi:hypothetical protein
MPALATRSEEKKGKAVLGPQTSGEGTEFAMDAFGAPAGMPLFLEADIRICGKLCRV